MEKNLKELRERITIDTQNALRIEGALLDVNEILAEDEKPEKEEKVEKKKVK